MLAVIDVDPATQDWRINFLRGEDDEDLRSSDRALLRYLLPALRFQAAASRVGGVFVAPVPE